MKSKLTNSTGVTNNNSFFGSGITNSAYSSSDFFKAIKNNDGQLIDILLKTELLNTKMAHENTPLHHAVNRLGLADVQKFLEAGANPNVINENGVTPLELAVDNCHMDQVGAASIVHRHLEKSTYYKDDSLEMIKLLLRFKADPNLSKDWNSVRRAFWRQNLAAAEILIPFLKKEDKNREPWYVDFVKAVLDGAFNIKLLDLLIKHGADLGYQPKFEKSYFDQVIHLLTMRKIFYAEDQKDLGDFFEEILQAYNYLLVHHAKPVDEKPLKFIEQEYISLEKKLSNQSVSLYRQITETLKSQFEEMNLTESLRI